MSKDLRKLEELAGQIPGGKKAQEQRPQGMSMPGWLV